MRCHPQWKQFQDVINDGCRTRESGKVKRLSTEQRRESDALAGDIIQEAGELGSNDALLLVSMRLNTPLTELVHAWDFEVDWQQEWGEREGDRGRSSASSSTGK